MQLFLCISLFCLLSCALLCLLGLSILKTGIVPIHSASGETSDTADHASRACSSSSYLYYEVKEGGIIHFTHFNKNVCLKNNSFFLKLDSDYLLSSANVSLSSSQATNHRSPHAVMVLDVYACEKKMILPRSQENNGEVAVSLLLSSGNVVELHFPFSSSLSTATAVCVENEEARSSSIFFCYYTALEGKLLNRLGCIFVSLGFSCFTFSHILFLRISSEKEFFTCQFC
jgi:hypothetical protein